jgi:hydroxyacylglutathione hydrolase
VSARIDTIRKGVVNTYLIRDRGAVLIDPGAARSGRAVLRSLGELLDPREIRVIIATHGHWDHIGAARQLREATGAPLAIHRDDARWLREGVVEWPAGVTPWGKVFRRVFGPLMAPFLEVPALDPDVIIGDEGLDLGPYGVAGRVVHTPGHSAGSVTVLLDGGEAFVGDLTMNGPPMTLRPRFGIFAHDAAQVPASWHHLLELGARTIYPAHGRPFSATALAA